MFVFGFGLQINICDFHRQNICSAFLLKLFFDFIENWFSYCHSPIWNVTPPYSGTQNNVVWGLTVCFIENQQRLLTFKCQFHSIFSIFCSQNEIWLIMDEWKPFPSCPPTCSPILWIYLMKWKNFWVLKHC